MNRNALLTFLLLPFAANAATQDYGREPALENVSYGYADVLRVDPVYDTVIVREPREECRQEEVTYRERSGGDPTGGTVLGAIIGGAIGNRVGKGDGRKAATVAGAVIGGAVGRDIDRNNGSEPGREYRGTRENCRIVDVETERREIAGYDVEYRYRGELFMSRLSYDPGRRLRIRVAISPVE
jgi:uncharacterized protein YcfJ